MLIINLNLLWLHGNLKKWPNKFHVLVFLVIFFTDILMTKKSGYPAVNMVNWAVHSISQMLTKHVDTFISVSAIT